MTNERCAVCNGVVALIGVRHRCIPQTSVGEVAVSLPITPVKSENELTITYRYRDPEKWRAYMRDYMRKRRNKDKANG